MDIIITGEQGNGKTHEAQRIIANYRPLYGKHLSDADILFIHDAYYHPGLITEMLRSARVRAVVFDGCITKPTELLACVVAVKEYRKQINADILAIYVAPGEAVMLTDGERKPYARNEFRTCVASATSNDGKNWVDGKIDPGKSYIGMARTDRILVDLWDLVSEKVDEAGAEAMAAKISEIVPEGLPIDDPGLHHLDSEGKITLLEFLLTLLRKYE